MTKKSLHWFLIFVFYCLTSASSGQADPSELPFAVGETITYNIEQMKVKAGTATLTFQGEQKLNDRTVGLITFKADGFNFLDEETIYVDPTTFLPVLIKRNLNIFGKKEKITEDYQPDGKIKITKLAGQKTSQEILTPQGRAENIYGFIYRYRKQGSFKIGDTIQLHLPTKDLSIELTKTLKLKTAGQEYDAFYLQSKPSKYKLWFDAGEHKIPLRIVGAVGIANTVMVMVNYKE